MRVLIVENYPNTSAGLVSAALRDAGVELETRRVYLGEPLPNVHSDFSGLVLLGGGQSALDDIDHPYLPAEAELARSFGEADKAVLGICLGAQLVARGYGARNILGRPLEFGWHEVRLTKAGAADSVLSSLGAGAPLFHWHTDTFTLPPAAVHLATSEATELQAFRTGRAVYGIQFHFEADTRMVADWTRVFAGEIATFEAEWPQRRPVETARHGAAADEAGVAVARAWTRLLQ